MIYKIGQKVRLARHMIGPDHMRKYVGAEGVVMSPLETHILSTGKAENCYRVDLKIPDARNKWIWAAPEELEPLLPPRGDPLVAATDLPPEIQELFDKVFEVEHA